MPVKIPSDFMTAWNDNFAAGNVDGILDLYAEDAVVVHEPGGRVQGKEQIRAVVEGFLAINQSGLNLTSNGAVEGAGYAMNYGDWTFEGDTPDGPLHIEARATATLVQRADGWYAVVDDFFSQA